MQTDTNKGFHTESTVCSISSAEGTDPVNCPVGNLSHVAATGSITVVARHLLDGESTRSSQITGREGGPGSPEVFASGGNGTLVVEWGEAASNGIVGSIDRYIVRNRAGTSGSWTATNKASATEATPSRVCQTEPGRSRSAPAATATTETRRPPTRPDWASNRRPSPSPLRLTRPPP